jgi:hypothetical protein
MGTADAEWIHLTQETDKLRAVVNTVMNIREIFWLAEQLPASQDGLCFIKLILGDRSSRQTRQVQDAFRVLSTQLQTRTNSVPSATHSLHYATTV